MNFQLWHELTFDALYACIAILIFVILERSVYLAYLSIRSARVTRALDGEQATLRPQDVKGRDPISRAVARYLQMGARSGASRERLEDLSSALFIEVDKRVSARLWILDTIITGAPLLGLLGTIFGIMQTFTALAEGGVSDPAQVSRGIGMALTATAVGIATALLGLLGHNILNRRAQLLTDDFKYFCLRLTPDHCLMAVGATTRTTTLPGTMGGFGWLPDADGLGAAKEAAGKYKL